MYWCTTALGINIVTDDRVYEIVWGLLEKRQLHVHSLISGAAVAPGTKSLLEQRLQSTGA